MPSIIEKCSNHVFFLSEIGMLTSECFTSLYFDLSYVCKGTAAAQYVVAYSRYACHIVE